MALLFGLLILLALGFEQLAIGENGPVGELGTGLEARSSPGPHSISLHARGP